MLKTLCEINGKELRQVIEEIVKEMVRQHGGPTTITQDRQQQELIGSVGVISHS